MIDTESGEKRVESLEDRRGLWAMEWAVAPERRRFSYYLQVGCHLSVCLSGYLDGV